MTTAKAGDLVGFLRGDIQTIGCPVLRVFNTLGEDFQLIWPDGTITALIREDHDGGASRWVTIPNRNYSLSKPSCSGCGCLRCKSPLVALALEGS